MLCFVSNRQNQITFGRVKMTFTSCTDFGAWLRKMMGMQEHNPNCMKLVLVTAVPDGRLSDMPWKYYSGSVTVNNTSQEQVKVICMGRCGSRV